MKKKKIFKKILIILLSIIVLGLIVSSLVNLYVKKSTENQIITLDNITNEETVLVLGAGVRNGGPTPVLKDRLEVAYEIYIKTNLPLIISGDHGQKKYDEVNIMKNYLIEKGIPSEKLFMDHAGFSTYDSIYRAKEIFKSDNIIIVSQEYHLHRALLIANRLDIKAKGISATLRTYGNESSQDIREYLARNKDFVKSVFKPEPEFLGEAIPVSAGNGNITND